ncbi:MAG: hypothetical protein P3X24_007845 [bacterium]|nr:hypothetical protein [bacterium]
MIQIQPIDIQPVATEWHKIMIVIAGRTPLLLHDRLAMSRAEAWRKANPREKAPPPEVEAEMGCVRDELGVILVRSDAVLESAKEGAKQVLHKLRTRTTNATREIASSIMPVRDSFRLFRPVPDFEDDPDSYLAQIRALLDTHPDIDSLNRAIKPLTPITEYAIDTRRVLVQRQGVMRSRPRIEPPWALVGEFEYDLGLGKDAQGPIAVQLVLKALGFAGQIVGIGDYRPQKGGIHGKYEVVRAWLVW